MADTLDNFVGAALEVMRTGLSGLTPEQAVLVELAQQRGADVVLVFCPGIGSIVGALHLPEGDVEPVPLFRVNIPFQGVSN